MARYLPDDPDLLRERRAPHRPRLHHHRSPTPSPAGTACSATTSFFLTGTDEHGLKVQQAAEAQRRHPRGVGRPDRRALPATRGGCSTSPTTTSSARPSRGTTRPSQQAAAGVLRRRRHRARHLRGPVLRRRARSTTPSDELDRARQLPDPRPPGRARQGGELLLPAQPLHSSRLLDWYEQHPDFVQPESKRNEALGFIRQGLRDFSISRTSITWGIPLPWDAGTSPTCGSTRSTNYITAVGYGSRRRAVRAWWPRRTT